MVYFHIVQVCTSNHKVQQWISQPILKQGKPLGDLMLSSSIVLSGNNYGKIKLLAKHMNLSMMTEPAFYRYQRLYVFPAVFKYWDDLVESNRQRLAQKPVILLGEFPQYIFARHCLYKSHLSDHEKNQETPDGRI